MSKDAPENPLPTIHAQGASAAAAKTGWAHDPYAAPDSDNARIAAISKEFIALFYQAALKRKCRVVTGVEIESDFSYDSANHSNTKQELIQYSNTALKKSLGNGKERSGIYCVYNDGGAIETVIWPQNPMRTVEDVTAIKKLQFEASREFNEALHAHVPTGRAARLRAAIPIQKVRFYETRKPWREATSEESFLFGEHLNISLHHTDEDTPDHTFDLAQHNITRAEYASMLEWVLEYSTRADAILLLHSAMSEKRIENRYGGYQNTAWSLPTVSHRWDIGGKLLWGEARRVEWKRPDSGSDIHLSMLTAMAATYAMVDATCHELGKRVLPVSCASDELGRVQRRLEQMLPMPRAKDVGSHNEERIQQFQNQSMVLKMMRQVVEQQVPAQQQGRYLEMIGEFKDAVIAQSRRQFPEAHLEAHGRIETAGNLVEI